MPIRQAIAPRNNAPSWIKVTCERLIFIWSGLMLDVLQKNVKPHWNCAKRSYIRKGRVHVNAKKKIGRDSTRMCAGINTQIQTGWPAVERSATGEPLSEAPGTQLLRCQYLHFCTSGASKLNCKTAHLAALAGTATHPAGAPQVSVFVLLYQ